MSTTEAIADKTANREATQTYQNSIAILFALTWGLVLLDRNAIAFLITFGLIETGKFKSEKAIVE
jgi:hypothetical protein